MSDKDVYYDGASKENHAKALSGIITGGILGGATSAIGVTGGATNSIGSILAGTVVGTTQNTYNIDGLSLRLIPPNCEFCETAKTTHKVIALNDIFYCCDACLNKMKERVTDVLATKIDKNKPNFNPGEDQIPKYLKGDGTWVRINGDYSPSEDECDSKIWREKGAGNEMID